MKDWGGGSGGFWGTIDGFFKTSNWFRKQPWRSVRRSRSRSSWTRPGLWDASITKMSSSSTVCFLMNFSCQCFVITHQNNHSFSTFSRSRCWSGATDDRHGTCNRWRPEGLFATDQEEPPEQILHVPRCSIGPDTHPPAEYHSLWHRCPQLPLQWTKSMQLV